MVSALDTNLNAAQALHITVTERRGIAVNEKLVLRCYKETAEATDGQPPDSKVAYLVQVNAGQGRGTCLERRA